MPPDSLDELITAIRARGEPIDYESLLNWPTPPTDLEGFQAAKNAFDAIALALQAFEQKKRDDTPFVPPSLEFIEQWRREIHSELERLKTRLDGHEFAEPATDADDEELTAAFWNLKSSAFDDFTSGLPFIREKPDVDRDLDETRWQMIGERLEHIAEPLETLLTIRTPVDWRLGLPTDGYFEKGSEYHWVIHQNVKILCLGAVYHGVRNGRDDWDRYLVGAASLGMSAGTIRLLISHLVLWACLDRTIDTTAYILRRVIPSQDALLRLLKLTTTLDSPQLLETSYVGERIFGLGSYRDKLPPDKREGDWWNRIKREKKISSSWYYLSNMARLIEIAQLPLRERFSSWLAFIQEPNAEPRSEDVNGTINGVAKPALPFNLIMLTRMRLMRAALTVLCDGPGLTTNDNLLPQDPFDPGGGPIRHRKIDDGFVVYSVGLDQVDSGGCGEQMDDYGPLRGMLPRRWLTKDIVLTVAPRQNGGVSLVWS